MEFPGFNIVPTIYVWYLQPIYPVKTNSTDYFMFVLKAKGHIVYLEFLSTGLKDIATKCCFCVAVLFFRDTLDFYYFIFMDQGHC